MSRNYNIQTRVVNTGSSLANAAIAVGPIVAAGKKRYVTFVAISGRTGSAAAGRLIYFCSTETVVKASTTTLASAAAKMVYAQHDTSAETNFSVPDKIDTEKPLFSIAESRYLTLFQVSAAPGSAAASVFVQYYDE